MQLSLHKTIELPRRCLTSNNGERKKSNVVASRRVVVVVVVVVKYIKVQDVMPIFNISNFH